MGVVAYAVTLPGRITVDAPGAVSIVMTLTAGALLFCATTVATALVRARRGRIPFASASTSTTTSPTRIQRIREDFIGAGGGGSGAGPAVAGLSRVVLMRVPPGSRSVASAGEPEARCKGPERSTG